MVSVANAGLFITGQSFILSNPCLPAEAIHVQFLPLENSQTIHIGFLLLLVSASGRALLVQPAEVLDNEPRIREVRHSSRTNARQLFHDARFFA